MYAFYKIENIYSLCFILAVEIFMMNQFDHIAVDISRLIEDYQRLSAENARLSAENARLRKPTLSLNEKLQHNKISQLTQKVKELTIENCHLRKEVETRSSTNDKLFAGCSLRESIIYDLEARVVQLTRSLHAKSDEINRLKKDAADLVEEINQWK